MRLVIARCRVDYIGRLTAHLPTARRLLLVKSDGSVSVHADDRAYKPLNWMSPPCTMSVREPDGEETDAGVSEVWEVSNNKTSDLLVIRLFEVLADYAHDLGTEPGLIKDGVEAHLQQLLAEQVDRLGGGSLIRREYPTPIGPVDLMIRDTNGTYVAVEVKRRGEIDGVEQLTRYLDLLGRDPLLQPLRGIFAAQAIKPQARVLAEDRGIECVILDYDEMRGIDHPEDRLF